MKRPCLLPFGVAAFALACSSPKPHVSASTTYKFGEGGMVAVKRDGQRFVLHAKRGHLYCNGVDCGPYRYQDPIQITKDGVLVVGGKRLGPAPKGR